VFWPPGSRVRDRPPSLPTGFAALPFGSGQQGDRQQLATSVARRGAAARQAAGAWPRTAAGCWGARAVTAPGRGRQRCPLAEYGTQLHERTGIRVSPAVLCLTLPRLKVWRKTRYSGPPNRGARISSRSDKRISSRSDKRISSRSDKSCVRRGPDLTPNSSSCLISPASTPS
jgi:hypothetical protein